MIYLFLFTLLFALQLLYFPIANKLNIIDKPNERSSHSRITLRGGGIVFWIRVLIYFVISGFASGFFAGLRLYCYQF
jgi:UDP-N-acetylmuramyl pentapeptide phosphotransferase/UDP-N-acetylglucosamine-1-phosphate transferase